MQPTLKKILRAVSLDLRHTLEGSYDNTGAFHPGDLETRLNALGVWRERPAKALDELAHLSLEDKAARQVIDAYIAYRTEAGISRAEAVAEFVRESAYNWANRLLALRCMEARGIIDEVILQKEIYGGRSLVHNRLARRNPAACAGPDDGLFAVLFQEFEERARELPELFAPTSPAIVLRPSLPALKHCLALLSGIEKPTGQEAATDEVFSASDALGWAYQYWNTEEKERVFEKVRTQKGSKIEGADIIPATQLYTEPYMVKFLVQNSLGATWMGMHPASKLADGWEYYVKDADRALQESKAIEAITQLDPACGSGHFHLEAFDLFFQMYREEHRDWSEVQIAASILNRNLYGIDIDERAVQIAAAALWMKAREYAPDLPPEALTSFHQHLVATNIRLPKGKDHLKAFLIKHPEAAPLQPALEAIFEGLENVNELGSLVQIEEPVEKELRYLREKYEMAHKRGVQGRLFEPTVIQGELPLGVESYEKWKTNTLTQLEQHFIEESESSDVIQRFFGLSAYKGVELFNLLAYRYDIVITNPPYMGSRNMGEHISSYVGKHLSPGKRDLFGTFIICCQQLCAETGYFALITLQGWLSLKDFSNLRNLLLSTSSLSVLAHLGRHAFSEADPPGNSIMFVWQRSKNNDHQITSFRLTTPRLSSEQALVLKTAIGDNNSSIKYVIRQTELSNIENTPIVYWVHPEIFQILKSSYTVAKAAGGVKQGLATGDNNHFMRLFWETTDLTRWVKYQKGGGYKKWYGLSYYRVDWIGNGLRYKGNRKARFQNADTYFCPGLTYTLLARGALGLRFIDNSVYDINGMSIFPLSREVSRFLLAAMLNSYIASFLARVISQDIRFNTGYITRLPLPAINNAGSLEKLSSFSADLKKTLISWNITEDLFQDDVFEQAANNLQSYIARKVEKSLYICAYLHSSEAFINSIIFKAYQLSDKAIETVIDETGCPAGWFPLIRNYDGLPVFNKTNVEIPSELINFLTEKARFSFSTDKDTSFKNRLEALYKAGQGFKENDRENEPDDNDDSQDDSGAHIPIPPETFLEELSQKLKIHPVSICWLLKDGIEQQGWRCPPEEKRITEDTCTVLTLRLLGHRWPTQIEAGEPVPQWADNDGVIPLTPGLAEPMLLERVRTRLPETFSGGNVAALEREFEEILGESLEKWLSISFFKHHISQFKKRPIAWQLSSRATNSTGGKGKKKGLDKAPAFSCLVYYHKLDHNSLTTLQSQYARPLRQSYETELRTLDNNAFLTPDQSSRRIQLEAWIDELEDFETRLEQCAREGFNTRSGSSTSPTLTPVAANEPLDRWTSRDGKASQPANHAEFEPQEMRYDPDLNDGVRVNIAPLQKFGLLAADVLDAKDIEKAIADRAEWRADERRWCREGKLPQPGWWK